MQNAAVEFALSGEYGNISAWYPPKLDKEKLVTFFEGDDSHDSDWDLEVEDLEDQSRSLKVSPLGPGRKAELSRKEMALPLLQVNAPEEIDGPRSRARAVGATRSHDREVSPRILVETI
ncbi:hypothetical protein GGS24DRAFT_447268 [Hypoxylon argillaceum]|nr:hypothetical protein GGS24DRAFT_447268 [Hypoxylon argillaceum]